MALPMFGKCLFGRARIYQYSHFITKSYGLQIPVVQLQRYSRQHPETPQFPNEFTVNPPKGKIYDKKPFRVELVAGKRYSWCACGASHNQPFCDGTHKSLWGTSEKKTMSKWQPHWFKAEETKEYWLCNCKQTNNRPFCDGTHKREDIQTKIRS